MIRTKATRLKNFNVMLNCHYNKKLSDDTNDIHSIRPLLRTDAK